MSGEPQLERSVLEGKERDKLQAIAEALGLKPAARAKKADLIDGILRATGVEVAPPAGSDTAKPKRVTRKRVGPAAAPGDGDQSDRGTLDLVAQAEEETVGEAATSEPVGPVGDDLPGAGGTLGAAGPEGTIEPGSGGTSQPAGSGGDEEPAGSGAVPDRGAIDVDAPLVEPSVPVARAEIDDQVAGNGGAPPGAAPMPQPRPQPARPAPQPSGPPGPGNHATPPAGANPNGPGAGGSGQPGQQPGQQPPGEGGEVRRNRRRRGRDRDRVGAGYDQQAQQGDQAYSGDPIPCDGLLELRPEGFGFLRTSGYLTGPDDVYVSISQVRKFALRAGDRIVGASRPATTQERFGALLRIDSVGDQSPDDARRRPRFDDLTPVFPNQRLTVELGDPSDPSRLTGRMVDLLTPIGKGQRGTIVSPPKAGKTTVLKHIAAAIEANHPEVDLMVLLVDERPEEVTDMRRSVKGDVIGSTFDRPPEEHTHVAELAVEVAKRRVEAGRDVVLILDGLTRLARAYNLSAPAAGPIPSGGLDAVALYPPKRLFGAARNVEEGGSLTILATLQVDTGSPVDAAVFEELRGTATMELRLDGRLAERRMYPAIDVAASSTARDELLLGEDELRQVWELRRSLSNLSDRSGAGSATSAYEMLVDKIRNARTNADLLAELSP